MKAKVPLPVLIIAGVLLLVLVVGLGVKALGPGHHDMKPPMTAEQIQAQNANRLPAQGGGN